MHAGRSAALHEHTLAVLRPTDAKTIGPARVSQSVCLAIWMQSPPSMKPPYGRDGSQHGWSDQCGEGRPSSSFAATTLKSATHSRLPIP